MKFTPAGGHVAIHVDLDGDPAAGVRLRVRDDGIGIAPERRDEIFHAFVQIDRSLTRPADGVGLGLTISRDLARGMGGDLTIEPRDGPGSTFPVPLRRLGAAEPHAAAGDAAGSSPSGAEAG